MKELTEEQKKIITESIRTVPNFPKKGIQFKDITTLLNSPEPFQILMNHLEARYKEFNLNYVAGIDARGFIFGSILADRLGIGFVPIRKKGKLPYKTISKRYSLEYGFDEVEIHIDAFRDLNSANVLLIDDLIATGGTVSASSKLIDETGANCVECCFIVELTFLNGREKVDKPIYSVIQV
jgi:adenine phosphoribosyltransferase